MPFAALLICSEWGMHRLRNDDWRSKGVFGFRLFFRRQDYEKGNLKCLA